MITSRTEPINYKQVFEFLVNGIKKYITDNNITNVGAGEGLMRVGSANVPFVNRFPKNTELYKLMTTKPGESVNE